MQMTIVGVSKMVTNARSFVSPSDIRRTTLLGAAQPTHAAAAGGYTVGMYSAGWKCGSCCILWSVFCHSVMIAQGRSRRLMVARCRRRNYDRVDGDATHNEGETHTGGDMLGDDLVSSSVEAEKVTAGG